MKKTQKSSNSPRVFLSQIGDRLHRFAWSEADSWLETLLAEGLSEERPAGSPAKISGELARQGNHFSLSGNYELSVKPLCGRCGKNFSGLLAGRLDLLLMPKPEEMGVNDEGNSSRGRRSKRPVEEEDEEVAEWGTSDELFVQDDIGASYFSSDEIDLSSYFNEQILLERPMSYLCRKDCPGLCSQCGADLSVDLCTCKVDKSDPRWDVLKKLKVR